MWEKPFLICGELGFRCQDGGYHADAFEIDGKDLDELVRDHFGVCAAKASESERDNPRIVGRVRIIIEKLTSDIEMDERKLRDYIGRFLPVAEEALANATGCQEFKLLEIPAMRFRNALSLLESGDINAAWVLLETSE